MIAKVFIDIDMRLGAQGLTEYLKEHRSKLDPGVMAMFLNRKKTQIKILWNRDFVLSFRKESGYITIDDIKNIPSYFKSPLFKNRSLEQHFMKHLKESISVELTSEGLKVG